MTASANRPLSPHLQIYRPQLTSILSIVHRASGLFLIAGTIAFSTWVVALSCGESIFVAYTGLLNSLPGQLFTLGCLFSFFYHLCNGVRHLLWDAGHGYQLRSVYLSGGLVVVVSVLMTVLAVLAAP